MIYLAVALIVLAGALLLHRLDERRGHWSSDLNYMIKRERRAKKDGRPYTTE
jgi:hypothetical protein